MPPRIETPLWTTLDNVELVRDQVAAILKVELEGQGVLGLTPVPRVFVERAAPWGAAVEVPPREAPIVNVWFDTETFDGASSNIVERQRGDAVINVDVYAFAPARETLEGHAPADEAAALAVQKTIRVVRRILMSAHYTYLDLRGIVWKRWPQTIGMFQPPIDQRTALRVIAGRLALAVQFNEFSPQVTGEVLETLSVEVKRAETGEIYLLAQYPSP